jgi:DNA-binding NtrC family response regulator
MSVLIIGESGTGKEVIAKVFMKTVPEKHNFIVDCGSIQKSWPSEFLTCKGSFTGARIKSVFEAANEELFS